MEESQEQYDLRATLPIQSRQQISMGASDNIIAQAKGDQKAREALGNDALASPNSAQMFDLNNFASPQTEISRFLLISV